ncbi:MAG: hypothetical protein WAM79_15830 [Candidatus Sulfotelmatobacter sp.]
MALIRKCQKCGLDLTDPSAMACPMCGTTLVARTEPRIWIRALIQFAFVGSFLLIFGFPKFMIAIFAGLIVIGTALSARLKPKQAGPRPAPRMPTRHPILFRVVSIGIVLCSMIFFATLLLGFVVCMNAWTRWHQYEGQPHHQTSFQVVRVYYQKSLYQKNSSFRSGVSVYASGTVEGQREWMNLLPYLHTMPRDLEELDERVPVGTSIPIYLFPNLKGRSRLCVLEAGLPSEASHRHVIDTLNYGTGGLALSGAIIFLLARLRRVCFDHSPPSQPLASQAAAAGSRSQ